MSSPANTSNPTQPRKRSISDVMNNERRQRWLQSSGRPDKWNVLRPGVSQFVGHFLKRGDQTKH
ncbi:hypothetical protein DACRYDRAFT_111840 [Dacryopinax primogenitus]|uniref:Uncharacterized protein n=1 Tax=Dacryopinax primogenitus (strain DJM 731) TaxID=1858805 RepID=M5FVE2_DACPD|nr:uncharacterized protein DACRYDRAFT_111840 [Dacryopinax primogenitus]EJT97296.1 hypothetical protein DACRYDRAFT_111840 [Dacryopinax primogenitus]